MCTRLRWLSPLALLALGAAPAPPPGPPGFQVMSMVMPAQPRRLAIGDLDTDGDLDLLVQCAAPGTAPLAVVRQIGNLWVPGWSANLGSDQLGFPADLDLGDLDADGDLDALANVPYAVCQSRLNAGNATFDAFKVLGGATRVQHALGQLDADALPDLATYDIDVIGYVGGQKGLGDGSFQFKAEKPVGNGDFATQAALGDVTGDGLQDLVRASSLGLQYTKGAAGAGFPGWGADVAVTTGALGDVALADVTGDGALDVVISRPTSNAIEVWRQLGGGLSGPSPFPGGPAPGLLAIADMNADGVLDVVTASQAQALVTVNTGSGNGVFLDLSGYRAARGPTDLVAADLDADGDTDLVEAALDGRVLFLFNKLVP